MTSPGRKIIEERGCGAVSLLLFILLLGAGLRFWALDANSIWLDEAYSWMQSRGSIADVLTLTAQDNYPPLHNLVLWSDIKLFGDSAFSLRFPSALFATLDIAAVFALARAVGGTQAGLMAAALLAVTPFDILHAHNARMYSLFSLLVTLYLYATVRYRREPGPGSALFGGAIALLLLYTHVYAALVFVSVNAAMLLPAQMGNTGSSGYGRRWFRYQAAAFALFLPWCFILSLRGSEIARDGFWAPEPDLRFLVFIVLRLFSWPTLLLAFGTLLLFLGAGTGLPKRDGRDDWQGGFHPRGGAAIVTAAVAGPFAAAMVFSVAVQPVILPRYFIFAIPAALAILGSAIAHSPGRIQARWLAVFATAALLLRPAIQGGTFGGFGEQWRQLASVQARYLREDERTVVFPDWAVPPYAYYMRDVQVVVPSVVLGKKPDPANGADRIWIVIRPPRRVFGDTAAGRAEKDRVVGTFIGAGFRLDREFSFENLFLVSLVRG